MTRRANRRLVLGAVLALLAVPPALAAVEIMAFHAANENNGTLVSMGLTREYLLHVPRRYDPARPAPLVISLHGAGGWPANQRDVSGWNALADEHGFLVVYPSGVSGRGPRMWHAPRDRATLRDVRFIADLIDALSTRYAIDATRIYANGLSNGGGMAFILSCTLSDRIAAVGMVGAAHLLPWSWCTDDTPVPMVAFHGTDDRMTPYTGGVTWVAPRPFPDIREWTAAWASRNRCAPDPIDAAVAADVSRRSYADCARGADVVLYSIEGGGHTWPGDAALPEWFLGRTTRSVDATREMWTFFQRHPLAGR